MASSNFSCDNVYGGPPSVSEMLILCPNRHELAPTSVSCYYVAMDKKLVIVTGSTRGIGKSIAVQLSQAGYIVHGVYNTSNKEAGAISKEHGIVFHQADLSNRQQTLKLVEELSSLNIYALVNNAGIWEMDNPNDMSFDTWDKTIEANLTAPLILSEKLSKSMSPGSSIVNISSTDGLMGAYNGISYSASKAALINVTKSLGNTLGVKGIRVNSIAPGWIATEMVDPDATENAKDTNPLGRIGKTTEIADVVEFLISEKASYINGTTIVVDGGGINVDYGLKKESGY